MLLAAAVLNVQHRSHDKKSGDAGQQTSQQEAPPDKMGPPPNTEKPKAVVVAKGDKPSTTIYQPACDKPKDREEADLCEQRRMASTAVWQLAASIFGLLFIAASLVFTGIATRAASRSADAAGAQVALSRQAMMQTERAFVHMKGLVIDRSIDAANPDHIIGWEIGVRWANLGSTPAQYCILRVYGLRGDQPMDQTFTFPDQETTDPPHRRPSDRMTV